MFLLVAFLIFSVALVAAGYLAWSVPQQQTHEVLTTRLRELRLAGGVRGRAAGDLMRREQRGALAGIGDFVAWLGILRRLQEFIDQANLKYRAAEVFALSVILAFFTYAVLALAGVSLAVFRIGLAVAVGLAPLVHILRLRKRR